MIVCPDNEYVCDHLRNTLGECNGWRTDNGEFCDFCFAAGTRISMAEDTLPIEKVKVGNMVKSLNINTMQVEIAKVTETFVHHDSTQGIIINGVIHTTSVHPFFVNGYFKEARFLKISDVLHSINGSNIVVRSLKTDVTPQIVYNFYVEHTANFFAEGILVSD